jgi:hypothetical protein
MFSIWISCSFRKFGFAFLYYSTKGGKKQYVLGSFVCESLGSKKRTAFAVLLAGGDRGASTAGSLNPHPILRVASDGLGKLGTKLPSAAVAAAE